MKEERYERWWQIEEIFTQALDLSPETRPAFLDEACAGDAELRHEVELLLQVQEAVSQSFLKDPSGWFGPLRSAGDQQRCNTQDDSCELIGRTISHYHIIERLGGGGMGVVYSAWDLKLGRLIALKFLPAHFAADDQAKERFIMEAQISCLLDHPHIVTIHELGETEEGQLFIAMGYYEGESLKKKIGQGPLLVEEVVRLAVQIADGLSAAHRCGVVHRDIKPANVMVTKQGVAKIVDFGIAKMAGLDLMKTGTMMGTVIYMSPEQVRGEEFDRRTDIWSLGVVLYEMLTGQQPFQGHNKTAIIYSILSDNPRALTGLRPDVPIALEQIVNKALEKDQRKRYQHMNEMLADLRGLTKQLAQYGYRSESSRKRSESKPLAQRSEGKDAQLS